MGQGGQVLGGEAGMIERPVFHKSAIGERLMTAPGHLRRAMPVRRTSATSPRRQVLPNDRTPRLTGAAPALGQDRPSEALPH
jgi:hypothetical protein